jgi:hypothetical protein
VFILGLRDLAVTIGLLGLCAGLAEPPVTEALAGTHDYMIKVLPGNHSIAVLLNSLIVFECTCRQVDSFIIFNKHLKVWIFFSTDTEIPYILPK